MQDHSPWVYWLAPTSLRLQSHSFLLVCHSSCFQKSKLEGIGWGLLLTVCKWQSPQGPCTKELSALERALPLTKSPLEYQSLPNNPRSSSSGPTGDPEHQAWRRLQARRMSRTLGEEADSSFNKWDLLMARSEQRPWCEGTCVW